MKFAPLEVGDQRLQILMKLDLFGPSRTIWIAEKIGPHIADSTESFNARRPLPDDVLDCNTGT
jgi:hypothetical protein